MRVRHGAADSPAGKALCTNRPDPTPPPGFLSRTFRYAGGKRSDSAMVPGRLRSTSSCVPSADDLWDQIDREALTRRLSMPLTALAQMSDVCADLDGS